MAGLISPNCSDPSPYESYYKVVTIAAHGEASADGAGDDARCTVADMSVMSCQVSQMEAADEVTEAFFRKKAKEKLLSQGCPMVDEATSETDLILDTKTVQFSNQNREIDPKRLIELGQVSNCLKVGHDINDVMYNMEARCTLFGDVEHCPEGGGPCVLGRSSKLKASAKLGVCDVSSEAEPQTHEDLRKAAALNALSRGYKFDPKDLECTFITHAR